MTGFRSLVRNTAYMQNGDEESALTRILNCSVNHTFERMSDRDLPNHLRGPLVESESDESDFESASDSVEGNPMEQNLIDLN